MIGLLNFVKGQWNGFKSIMLCICGEASLSVGMLSVEKYRTQISAMKIASLSLANITTHLYCTHHLLTVLSLRYFIYLKLILDG